MRQGRPEKSSETTAEEGEAAEWREGRGACDGLRVVSICKVRVGVG